MITVKCIAKKIDVAKAEELIHFALDWKLANVKVSIVESEKTLDMLKVEDYELQAILYRPTPIPHEYTLVVRRYPRPSLEAVVFHEATHLMQYESGRLEVDIRSGKCKWDGEEYQASYPYMRRPWEKEAFAEQRRLMKEWRALQKSVKKVRKCLFKKK